MKKYLLGTLMGLLLLPATAQAYVPIFHVNGVPATIPRPVQMTGTVEVESAAFPLKCSFFAAGSVMSSQLQTNATFFYGCKQNFGSPESLCSEEGGEYLTTESLPSINPESKRPFRLSQQFGFGQEVEEREGLRYLTGGTLQYTFYRAAAPGCGESSGGSLPYTSEGLSEVRWVNGTHNGLKPSHLEGRQKVNGSVLTYLVYSKVAVSGGGGSNELITSE